MRQAVQAQPDATLAELAKELGTSDTTVDRWLRKLEISLEKSGPRGGAAASRRESSA